MSRICHGLSSENFQIHYCHYHNKDLLWLAMHNRRRLPSWHRVHDLQVRNEEVHAVGAPRRVMLQSVV